MIRSMIARLGALWCMLMHTRISWPVSGHYTCWQCLRVYSVCWETPAPGMLVHKRHHAEAATTPREGGVLRVRGVV